MVSILVFYYLSVNVLGLILMGYDKNMAIRKKRRVPEHTLLAIAFIGGAAGSLLGMGTFRHKTRKPKFRWLVPLALILHIVILIAILYFRRQL